MGIFDIFKRDEEYKGFKLSRDVDPALQKQLIDRGRGNEVNSLTPDFVSKANSSNQTANSTPMMIAGGKNSFEPKLYDRFDPKKEVGMAKATLQEFGKLGEVDNFNKEIVAPVTDAVLSNKKVQQGLENTVGWANAVDDTLQGKVIRDDGSMALVSDLPIAQQAVGYAVHGLNRVGLGVLGTTEATLNGMKWLGVEDAKPMADKIADWQKAAGTADGGFLDQLMSGVGSAASFFVPGIGMSSLSGIVGTYSPRVLQLLGGAKGLSNIGMTAFEALSEAGDSYNQALLDGKSEKEADMAGTNTFWANAILIGITNKFGFLAEGKGIKKVLASIGMESTQEFGQQVIQNLSQDKTGTAVFDGAFEAAAIGGILGGVFGMSDLGSMGTMPYKRNGGIEKEVAVPESFTRVENEGETKYFQTPSEATSYITSNNISDTAVVTQLGKEDAIKIISENKLPYFPFEGGMSQDQIKVNETIKEIQTKTGVSEQEATRLFGAVRELIASEKLNNEQADDIFQQAVDQAKIENGITPDIINEAVKIAEASVGIKAADEVALQEKQAAQLADQYVTTEEAMASSKNFPFIQKLNIPLVAKKQILTASGKQALGKYSKGMIEFVENPKASTVPHEAVHAYMDIMMSKSQKQSILNEAKRRFAGKIASAKKSGSYKSVNVKGLTDDAIAEEILAEDMINYVKTGQASSNKLKRFYDWFVEQVKNLLGKGNLDIIDKFYKDVQSNPGVMQREAARKRLEKTQLDIAALQKEYLQNPDALTTKFLENVDVKNREFASYEFLKNLLKSKSLPLKENERTLIDNILDEQFKDEKKINMDDFRAAVRGELLPLQVIPSDTYADYGSSQIDMDSEGSSYDFEYTTNIYNSPFNHGYTGHFGGDFSNKVSREDLEIKQIPGQNQWAVIRKGVELTEDNIAENVLQVANSEEAANKWIEDRSVEESNWRNGGKGEVTNYVDIGTKGLFGHTRVWKTVDNVSPDYGIRYISEIQSDSFQNPERLEGYNKELNRLTEKTRSLNNDIEIAKSGVRDSEQIIDGYTKLVKFLKEGGAKKEGLLNNRSAVNYSVAGREKAGYIYDTYGIPNFIIQKFEDYYSPEEVLRVKDLIDYSEQMINKQKEILPKSKKHLEGVTRQVAREKIRVDKEIADLKISKEELDFLKYKNIWHERMIREEIRRAAMEGDKSMRVPTPYTISKIEGYLSSDGQIPTGTTTGDRFDYGGEDYIVLTEDQQMGEDAARVAPVSDLRTVIDFDTVRDEDIENEKSEIVYELENAEDFDEAVNENYILSRHLTNEETALIKKDYKENQDLTTNTIDDLIDKAVEAEIDSRYADAEGYAGYYFEESGEETMFAYDNQIIVLNSADHIETMSYGGTAADKEGFNYEDDLDAEEHKTVARFYDKQVGRYLAKLRKQNFRIVTDDRGYDWYETDILPEDKAAVEAFQTPANVAPAIQRTGKQVADYVEEVQQGKLADAEEYGEDIDTEPLSAYMRGVISNQSYTLSVVKIKDLLEQDEDLREYVKNGEQRYPDGVENPDNIDLPIVVGTWGINRGVVLDGYNRTLSKLQNGDEVIEAWISNDGKGLSAEEKQQMIDFIDYARGNTAEDIKLEIDARYLAEGLTINPNVSNKVLANRFEKRLNEEPKFQEIWYHGTESDITSFDKNFDYENISTGQVRDYEVPYGMVFLSSDVKESNVYGRNIIKAKFIGNKILNVKSGNTAPSIFFDEEYNYGDGKLWNKFENGAYDAIKITDNNGKSTLITFPEMLEIYVGDEKYQELDERTNELMMRREDLQRQIEKSAIDEEDRIQIARERSLEYSDSEKENGYQAFAKMASRRPWILDNQTDERMIKDRLPAINIDNTLFSANTGQTNNELLEEFKDRYYQEKELAAIAAQKTPMEVANKNAKLAARTVKKATIGKPVTMSRALKVATGVERPIVITQKESVLLKARLRDMVKASKAGYAIGRAEMRADLNLAFAGQLQYQGMIKDAIIAYAKDLPVADRGDYLTAVAKAKNVSDMAKAFARIDAALKANDNKEQITQMAKMAKKVKQAMATGRGIAVDYQKKIADILQDYSLKKPTAATIEKLNGLAKYIEQNPDANIPAHLIKRLDTLKKMSPKDIENDSLRDLNDLLLRLWNLGELKMAMKGKYNERFIKASVDKLLTTTVNVDKKSIGGLSWLHAPRVADILDGVRRYKGFNVALQKKVSHSVAKAMQRSEQVIKEALDYISAIKNEFTKEEQAIMAFNMAKDQGLYSQAQALIGAYAGEYGWKTEADLVMTQEMTHAVNVLRGTFAKTVDYLAAVYEEIENKPFIKGENYFPNKYDKNFDKNVDLDAPTIGEMQNYQGKQINKGFTIARMKGVKKVLRTDIFNVFAEAISEQQYYMGVQPVLNEIANIVKQPAYQERVGKVGVQWWDRYLKGVANKGRSLNRGIFDAWLREKRLNISKAVLGYKLTSAILQPTAIIDAYAYVYLNHGALAANELILQLAANLSVPGYTKRTVAKSLGLQLRKGDAGEQVLQELANDRTSSRLSRALTKGGMWALRGLDIKTAASVQKTMYNYFRRKGMDQEAAQREADFVMNLTQGSSEIGDVPLVLMEGEAYRTLLTFQTFVLNRWGLITHDIIRSGIMKGGIMSVPRKLKGLLALFLLSLAGGVENILRKTIGELTTGKEYPEKFNFWQQSLLTVPEAAPVVGSLLTSAIEYGQGASVPLSRLAENIVKGSMALVNPTGDTKKEQEISRTKGALKLSEALATYYGVSGSAQAFDFIDRLVIPEASTKSAGGSNTNLMPELPKPPKLPAPPKLPKPPMR